MNAKQRAARELRRARHAAVLKLPRVHEVITVNDDFTDNLTDVPALARNRDPLGITAQESKGIDYRKRLGKQFGVRQRMADDATQGVAVVWDRNQATAIQGERDVSAKVGYGWRQLVGEVRGEMLARGVVWQDLEVTTTGDRFRLASTHRPPWRIHDRWPAFDDALEAWLNVSPLPVLLGMDANERGGPNVDPDYRWRGIGIDGFLSDLPVPTVFELAWRNSDHRPVSGGFRATT